MYIYIYALLKEGFAVQKGAGESYSRATIGQLQEKSTIHG